MFVNKKMLSAFIRCKKKKKENREKLSLGVIFKNIITLIFLLDSISISNIYKFISSVTEIVTNFQIINNLYM